MKKSTHKSIRNFQAIIIPQNQLKNVKGGDDSDIGVQDVIDG